MEQSQTPTKRYFVTSETGNKFPPEFINSRNRKYIVVRNCKVLFEKAIVDKYIVVRNCKVLFEKAIVDDVELHADFVKVDHHKNHFVNFVNDLKFDPCKYEYFGQYPYFTIWFTDMKGNLIEPEAFTLRLLLIY